MSATDDLREYEDELRRRHGDDGSGLVCHCGHTLKACEVLELLARLAAAREEGLIP